jgi:hypothetical protein
MADTITVGALIYYTGDMANADGSFIVTATDGAGVDLAEVDTADTGRTFRSVRLSHIGHEYAGTCSPRFVTMEAKRRWSAVQMENLRNWAARS